MNNLHILGSVIKVDASKMKNMIIIKELPSNIVEEAYVVLKPNVKLKKKEKEEIFSGDKSQDYIIKEAENVVNNYLSNLENNKIIKNLEVEKIKKKYNKLKRICMGLGIVFIFNLIIQIIR